MNNLILLLSVGLTLFSEYSGQEHAYIPDKPKIVMDIPGYPAVFELNKGDSILMDRTYKNKHVTRIIRLKDFRLFKEYNSWFPDSPGYYSEELIVKTASGAVDKDFLQVRICDQDSASKIAYGWAYYSPVRNIKPGQEILFWNRLNNTDTDVKIDFGDGTAPQQIKEEIKHSYSMKGIYTVELRSTGISNEPVSVKLEVIID